MALLRKKTHKDITDSIPNTKNNNPDLSMVSQTEESPLQKEALDAFNNELDILSKKELENRKKINAHYNKALEQEKKKWDLAISNLSQNTNKLLSKLHSVSEIKSTPETIITDLVNANTAHGKEITASDYMKAKKICEDFYEASKMVKQDYLAHYNKLKHQSKIDSQKSLSKFDIEKNKLLTDKDNFLQEYISNKIIDNENPVF